MLASISIQVIRLNAIVPFSTYPLWYNNPPHATLARIFSSHADADAADRTYYQSLTPQERLDILLTLIERGKKPHQIGQPIAHSSFPH